MVTLFSEAVKDRVIAVFREEKRESGAEVYRVDLVVLSVVKAISDHSVCCED